MEEKTLALIKILKARFSAKKGKALTWDDFFKMLLERERKKEVVKSWLYTLGIFIVITLILMPTVFGVPLAIPFIFLIGFAIAFFSAYVLTPLSLRGIKTFKDAPPQVLEALRELSIRAGLKKSPELMFAETSEINALAYISISGSRVCVTRGLIEAYKDGNITSEELNAIIGHEIGHIKNFDCLMWSFVLSWIEIFDKIGTLIIGIGLTLSAASSRKEGGAGIALAISGWFLAIMGFSYKIAAKIASILAFHLSRRQEYAADRFSAELTNPEIMASALQKIDTLNDRLVVQELSRLPYAERWQLQPRNPSWIDKLWNTHPSTEKRVGALSRISEFLKS